MLVDARLVSERVLTHNRLVPLYLHPGDARHQPTGRKQPAGVHTGVAAEVVASCRHRHHDFFERRVARPLAQAIDRALDLPGTLRDGGQAVGHGQAQVVVTVSTQDRLLDVGYVLLEVPEDRSELLGRRVAHRIGDIDRRRPRVDRLFDNFTEKIQLGPCRILRRKLHVVAVLRRATHHLDSRLDDLRLVHLQLELTVDRTGGQEHVQPPPLGILERRPRTINVLNPTPSQAANRRAVAAGPRHHLHGFEVAGRGDREAGLDHVHTQLDQRIGHLKLLGRVHAAAG